MPPLFTRMSTCPNFSNTVFAAKSNEAGSAKSNGTIWHERGCAHWLRTLSNSARLREESITSAPFAEYPFAKASPIPEEAPVIQTTGTDCSTFFLFWQTKIQNNPELAMPRNRYETTALPARPSLETGIAPSRPHATRPARRPGPASRLRLQVKEERKRTGWMCIDMNGSVSRLRLQAFVPRTAQNRGLIPYSVAIAGLFQEASPGGWEYSRPAPHPASASGNGPTRFPGSR